VSKLRIGVVGTGQRVCYHGACVFAEAPESARCDDVMEVAALCDVRPDRLALAKSRYEEHFRCRVETYVDYAQMYARAGLDAVYVAGPNHLHRDMTVAALERGLHVLCEKPMELTLAKCDEMIRAADKAGRVLALAMQMHYRRRYHKVREMIEAGVVGEPAMLWCVEHRGPFPEMKDWVWDKAMSGGAIVEKNCHHYDILDLWVQSEPTTVYATGGVAEPMAYGKYPTEIVDNAWVVNDYACGARAMVGIGFLAGERRHSREFGVVGTEAKVWFSLDDDETLHVQPRKGEPSEVRVDGVLRGGLFRDFVDCILTGAAPLVCAERGRRSMLVPLAAERSIEERRAVHVSELA